MNFNCASLLSALGQSRSGQCSTTVCFFSGGARCIRRIGQSELTQIVQQYVDFCFDSIEIDILQPH